MPLNDPMNLVFNTIFPVIITVIFLFLLITAITKGISTWSYNNSQPKLTVVAKIVSKRENTSYHTDSTTTNFTNTSTSTTYYVTFEVESGDRMEFSIDGHEYGMLAEQDKGMLTFQGKRYLGFKRVV